jgi:hypothetical protein
MKSWLRRWLGIDAHDSGLALQCSEIARLSTELETERNWKTEIIALLKAKAQQSQRAVPVYADYESAQVLALSEFKEKN